MRDAFGRVGDKAAIGVEELAPFEALGARLAGEMWGRFVDLCAGDFVLELPPKCCTVPYSNVKPSGHPAWTLLLLT